MGRFFICKKLTTSAGCCLAAIIKTACGAASEEARCIPLPPRRRKLHIRWLLLPFQTVTAALGHSLGIRVHFRFRRFSFFSSPGAAVLFFLKKRKKRMGRKSGGQGRPPLHGAAKTKGTAIGRPIYRSNSTPLNRNRPDIIRAFWYLTSHRSARRSYSHSPSRPASSSQTGT